MKRKLKKAKWLIAASGLVAMPTAMADSEAIPESRQTPGVEVSNGAVSGKDACSSVPTQVETPFSVEARGDEVARFDVPASGALSVEVPSVSGIVIRTSDSEQLEVTVCKKAWADDPETARSTLEEIGLSMSEDTLVATGPPSSPERIWSAHLLIAVPEGVALDLRAERGSITLQETTGDIRAQTRHGGIFATPQGGSVALASENGSIDLRLSSATWKGRGVVARSRNGSLRAALPAVSPFVITAQSEFGQVRVQGEELRQAIEEATSESDASTKPRLLLATVNGPLFVRTTD